MFNRLQYSVNITFICTGKQKKKLCDSLYYDIHFTVMVWNQTCNIPSYACSGGQLKWFRSSTCKNEFMINVIYLLRKVLLTFLQFIFYLFQSKQLLEKCKLVYMKKVITTAHFIWDHSIILSEIVDSKGSLNF